MGARLFAPIQTSPGAHPVSYTMGTGSFPEVKWPGHGNDHPPPSSAEIKERVELYLLLSLWAFVAFSRVKLSLPTSHHMPWVHVWTVPHFTHLYVVILSCSLFTRHDHILTFSAYTFWPISFLATKNPFFLVYIYIISINQKLMCTIKFHALVVCWNPPNSIF